MTAPITCPWIDPLAIIDPYLRLVLAPNANDLVVRAAINLDVSFSKGAPRAAWLAASYNSDTDDDHESGPVVTLVPLLRSSPVLNGTSLEWHPLRFAHLTRWIVQLDFAGLSPDPLVLLPLLCKRRLLLATQLNHVPSTTEDLEASANSSVNARALAQQRDLIAQLHTLLHVLQHPLDETPFVAYTALTPVQIARLIVPVTQQQILAFSTFSRASRQWLSIGTDNRREGSSDRHEWRRVQHHGFKPDPYFYGKGRWGISPRARTLYAGIELEMDLPSENANAIMQRAIFSVADEFGPPGAVNGSAHERLHIEQDGSLGEHGLEVVLMPHEVHSLHGEAFWRRVYQTACSLGATNSRGRAGMHIHVSAAAVFARPNHIGTEPFDDNGFKETTALLIDLITAMLAGGPNLWPLQPNHQACSKVCVFGRNANWTGQFAEVSFSLFNPQPGLRQLERYRHVNWNNHATIEFRLFGPNGFDARHDWINICTQLVSAIVQLARATALDLIRNPQVSATPWLYTMLQHERGTAMHTTPNGLRIGVGCPANNSRFHDLANLHTSVSGRVPQIELAIRQVWALLLDFLADQTPQFDILREYLHTQVVPHLPTTEQLLQRQPPRHGMSAERIPPLTGTIRGRTNTAPITDELTQADVENLTRNAEQARGDAVRNLHRIAGSRAGNSQWARDFEAHVRVAQTTGRFDPPLNAETLYFIGQEQRRERLTGQVNAIVDAGRTGGLAGATARGADMAMEEHRNAEAERALANAEVFDVGVSAVQRSAMEQADVRRIRRAIENVQPTGTGTESFREALAASTPTRRRRTRAEMTPDEIARADRANQRRRQRQELHARDLGRRVDDDVRRANEERY